MICAEHVVPFIGDPSSGPAASVPALCRALVSQGARVRLHTLAPAPAGCFDTIASYPRARFPLPSLGRSPLMRRALIEAARSADVVHNHSLWMLNNIYPADAVRGTDSRLVCSPRGTMSDWAWKRRRGRKQLMGLLGQSRMLRAVHLFHATSPQEADAIRRRGFLQPVVVIPNGVEIPEALGDPPGAEGRRVLFLGRIHVTKGLEFLIDAWAEVQRRHPDCELRLVGPGDATYVRTLRSRVQSRALRHVTFRGPVHGAEREGELAAASVLVLPSHTENFGMAVAEALARAVPVVVSRGAPWQDVHDRGCGWWIDPTPAMLAHALREALDLPASRLRDMGLRGRAWMRAAFSWDDVGRRMLRAYKWLCRGGDVPRDVRLDR